MSSSLHLLAPGDYLVDPDPLGALAVVEHTHLRDGGGAVVRLERPQPLPPGHRADRLSVDPWAPLALWSVGTTRASFHLEPGRRYEARLVVKREMLRGSLSYALFTSGVAVERKVEMRSHVRLPKRPSGASHAVYLLRFAWQGGPLWTTSDGRGSLLNCMDQILAL